MLYTRMSPSVPEMEGVIYWATRGLVGGRGASFLRVYLCHRVCWGGVEGAEATFLRVCRCLRLCLKWRVYVLLEGWCGGDSFLRVYLWWSVLSCIYLPCKPGDSYRWRLRSVLFAT